MKESKQATKTEMLVRGTVINPIAIDAAKYLVGLKPELRNQVALIGHRQIPGFLEWMVNFKHENFFVAQNIDEISLESYDHKTKLVSLKLTFDKDIDNRRVRLIDENPDDLKDCICLNDNYDWRYNNDILFNDITNGLITQAGIDEYRKFTSTLEKKHNLRSPIGHLAEQALKGIEKILARKDTHKPAILWVNRPTMGRSRLEGRNELRLIPNELHKELTKKTKRVVPREHMASGDSVF